MELFILFGVIVLCWTAYELYVAETDTLLICDWLWFDFNRWENPFFYWLVIVLQTALGIAAIALGLGYI